MDSVNALSPAGSSSNQAFIRSEQQSSEERIALTHNMAGFGYALFGKLRMLKAEEPRRSQDEIEKIAIDWAMKCQSPAADISNEDAKGPESEITQSFQFMMSMATAKAWGAAEERGHVLHEKLEAEQKKLKL